jgi:glycosyltransferase involved in cell wall biosynthesis
MAACFLKGIRIRDVDVIYATSTPLTIGIPAMLLKWFKRKPFVFEVRDQWPEVPIEMGIIQNLLLKKLLLWMEKRIYKSAMAIVALSPGMAKGVRQVLGKTEKPILIAPNSADIELFRPEIDGSVVRRKMGWEDKFVVMHFGTMGKVNSLDFLIQVAKQLQSDENLLFVLVGHGKERASLSNKIDVMNLNNVLICDPVKKSELPKLVAACDVSTVIIGNYPIIQHNSANKFFDSLAAGKPVILNYSGWQREILEQHNAGFGGRIYNLEEYITNLIVIRSDPDRLKIMGQNARRLAETEFNRDKVALEVLSVLEEARNASC